MHILDSACFRGEGGVTEKHGCLKVRKAGGHKGKRQCCKHWAETRTQATQRWRPEAQKCPSCSISLLCVHLGVPVHFPRFNCCFWRVNMGIVVLMIINLFLICTFNTDLFQRVEASFDSLFLQRRDPHSSFLGEGEKGRRCCWPRKPRKESLNLLY